MLAFKSFTIAALLASVSAMAVEKRDPSREDLMAVLVSIPKSWSSVDQAHNSKDVDILDHPPTCMNYSEHLIRDLVNP
ncbi:hypothetical protein G7Y89_g6663 [Cudoniella acicularis]|uniref:Uncharacterized protein n=1 Tax=Cudoniella acicularis TaxID=354080 RepID=A0A8H4W4J4_9HELO|nr:hypothetical protein G7Y89_g6663 [Cudoniella acicularis]